MNVIMHICVSEFVPNFWLPLLRWQLVCTVLASCLLSEFSLSSLLEFIIVVCLFFFPLNFGFNNFFDVPCFSVWFPIHL